MRYFLLISLFVFTSCVNNKYSSFNYQYSADPWIDAFKDRFFFTALKEAYKLDTEILARMEKLDAFNPYDGLSMEEMTIADSTAKALMIGMPTPGMCEGCKGEKNYFIATALHYYNSRELDSLAKKYYRKHLK